MWQQQHPRKRVLLHEQAMDDIFYGHSVFYHISKASDCKFWSTNHNDDDAVTAFTRSTSILGENDDAPHLPLPNTTSNWYTNTTQNNHMNGTGTGCCSGCLQLLHIIRTEQHKLCSKYSRNDSKNNITGRSATSDESKCSPPIAISNVTGGTILHALLQTSHTHCPQLIYTFLMDALTKSLPGSICHENIDSHHFRWMLLHRDRNEDLPIHFAASMLRSASDTLSIPLLQFLLHQTLMAQRLRISLCSSSNLCGTYHPLCTTYLSCNYLPPYILSLNRHGISMLDIVWQIYLSRRSDIKNKQGRPNYDYRRALGYDRNRGIEDQVVDQIVRRDNSSHDVIHNHFIQKVTIIIRAAYIELLLVQQYCNVSTESSYPIRDRRSLDDITNQFSTEKDDDKYILHYASALCGPKSGSISYDGHQPRSFGVTASSDTRFSLPPSSRKIQFMRVKNSILMLLLHRWGTHTIRSVHPITGQLPLHYAVKSYCSRFLAKSCRLEFLYGSMYCWQVRDSLEWIRTLLRIYPAACKVKDRHGYIPLHYAILQTVHDCDCHSDDGMIERCPFIGMPSVRSLLVNALIQAYPPSIDISCRMHIDRCTDDRHSDRLPQVHVWSNGAIRDDATTACLYDFEVFQLAAMICTPSCNGDSCSTLSLIYTILRMSPARLFVGDV
jgi:hypothetical protein